MRKRSLLLVFVASFLLSMPARAVFALDCNGNAVEDADDIEAATSVDCNGNGLPDECEDVLLQFGLRGGGGALDGTVRDMISGDLNGDGVDDLVAATAASNNSGVTIFLSDGVGGTLPPMRKRLANIPVALAQGDIDGDGHTDLVAMSSSSIAILWNEGNDSFAAPSAFDTMRGVFDGVVGDFDSDDVADLLIINKDEDEVFVFSNNGDRTFAEPRRIAIGNRPYGLTSGDFNGDGDLDVLVTNWTSRDLSLVYSENGQLGAATSIALEVRSPRNVVAHDRDGDGDLDVIVTGLERILTFTNSGNGELVAAAAFERSVQFVDLADLDGDGDRDLVSGSSSNVGMIATGADGALEAFYEIPTEVAPRNVKVGDYDGDGKLDVALATVDAVRVLWNGEENSLTIDQETQAIGDRPHAAIMADLDGDGDPDFASGNGLSGQVSVVLSQGDGTFRLSRHYPTGGYLNSLAVGDLDGDGDFDLITADRNGNRVRLLYNQGEAQYTVTGNFRTGNSPFFLHAGDLDGDGFPDVASANEGDNTVSIFLNDGEGSLRAATNRRVGSRPTSLDFGDIDGDGDLDIAVSNQRATNVSILTNDGDGGFPGNARAVSVQSQPAFVLLRDTDRDGDLDIVTANEGGGTLTVAFNAGDGTYPDNLKQRFPVGDAPYSLASGDINGDGFDDMVCGTNAGRSTVTLMLNDGAGGFFSASRYTVGREPRYNVTGDIDLDGDIDFVAANHQGASITILRNTNPVRSGEDFFETICTAFDFRQISLESTRSTFVDRTLKYLMPARDDPTLLDTVYQNARLWELHQDFMAAVFPERFPGLTIDEYRRLVEFRATRDYYVGTVSRISTQEGFVYGFSIVTAGTADELLSLDEVRAVYERMSESFFAGQLAYHPITRRERTAAAAWVNPGFPIIDVDTSGVEFVPYTTAVGYGRVRLMDEDAFNEANESGRFTFQDLIVLDFAPRDIEGVVGGVVTGEIQTEASHVSVRTSRRGTPNAFIANAFTVFEPWEGQLVRFEVTLTGYTVAEATVAEAEEFWADRPDLGDLEDVDAEYARLDSMEELDLAPAGRQPESRYGGKATNFARLQTLLTGDFENYSEVAFAIPMRYYLEFMRSNSIRSALDAERIVTYEEYILELSAAEEFQSDSELRFALLEDFRDFMEDNGVVPRQLLLNIATRAVSVFGDSDIMLRSRSSSNVEDLLDFNGAGLYDSRSICPADELDADQNGPSRCDRFRSGERTIEEGLKRVWASLWTFRAYEERAFYQIPQEDAAMGVLVTRAFLSEEANGVAFTGNTTNPTDRRYTVIVQAGEESVVNPNPSVRAERTSLLMAPDGSVFRIFRERSSSLLPDGEVVLTDEQYEELGALLWHVDQSFPIDLEGRDRDQVLLDFEFKIEPGGDLAVKQVRPFLLSTPRPPAPVFELDVPGGAMACAIFDYENPSADPERQFLNKSSIRFREGVHELPTANKLFFADLIEELRFGPDRTVAEPLGEGLVEVNSRVDGADTIYSFTYAQEFRLPDTTVIEVNLLDLQYSARGEQPVVGSRTVDPSFIFEELALTARINGEDVAVYGSCDYDMLPLWRLDAELSDGTVLQLLERFLPSENDAATGPAGLIRGSVDLGNAGRQITRDYWRLVYTSTRHNVNAQYWVVLDPPVSMPGLPRDVAVVEYVPAFSIGAKQFNASARYLDAELETLRELDVVSESKEQIEDLPEPVFMRGDLAGDGVNVTDVVQVLDFLFRGGGTPTCLKSADVNDDGSLNITDPVSLLGHLFQGFGDLAAPFGECGVDPTDDALTCEIYEGCQ